MKVTQAGELDTVIDVLCDVCGMSTRKGEGELQYGKMHASWGRGSTHCGEMYELHLCETCFFSQVAEMKRKRWLAVMFDEEGDAILGDEGYGRVIGATRDGDGKRS
ncbi:MAG: hypothetical protein P0Y58_22640 [Candidatus Pseudomonas phytovorans]|uniref:Uncharacterized protein n=1 Tax=Candidatus Pseudomonas phytovorans TaxID=3121377 RepID=A0AAJ5WF45_9PSED|nr:hypothetical protein [Pseudomonas sp.]WEK29665.1 MAG: hypothetical protein P0Y58_22640 [Pseudomonas sp.]